MCLPMWVYVHCVCAGAQGGQEKAEDPLQLDLQVAVSCPACVLRTDLWSSVRVVCSLNCGIISPAPNFFLYTGWFFIAIQCYHPKPEIQNPKFSKIHNILSAM